MFHRTIAIMISFCTLLPYIIINHYFYSDNDYYSARPLRNPRCPSSSRSLLQYSTIRFIMHGRINKRFHLKTPKLGWLVISLNVDRQVQFYTNNTGCCTQLFITGFVLIQLRLKWYTDKVASWLAYWGAHTRARSLRMIPPPVLNFKVINKIDTLRMYKNTTRSIN